MFRNPLIDAVVVLVAILLIFGPKRLPLLGRGMREFRDSISSDSSFSEEDERPALTESVAAPTATLASRSEPAKVEPGPPHS